MNSAEIRQENGIPALYIDEQRRLPILFGLSDIPGSATNTVYAHKNIANFAAQGIHLITADVELQNGWHKVSPFEWEPMQEEIAAAMEADPETGIILRFHVNPPYWWMRDNPGECVSYRDHEVIDDGEQLRLIRNDTNKNLRVSLASQKWLTEAGECLRKFCENVWNTPEGSAVLGIQIACGVYGEWHQWGPDRSRPMIDRFRRLLREKYKTDEALQKAWGDRHVTFETAHFVPESDQRGDDGCFRDPVRSRDIMDSQLCIQTVGPEAIIHFCEIVKKYWGRPVLAGTFYGYYLGTLGPGVTIGGHLLPELLYQRKDVVDFLCGPFPYLQNRDPDAVPMQRGLLESNRLHGMLWLTEMDQHPAGTEHFIGGDPSRIDETVAQLRRNTLQPIMAGQGFWYYDHRLIPQFVPKDGRNPYAGSLFRKTGWWDNPILLKEINALQRLFEHYALREHRPAADVLIVYHPHMHFSQADFFEKEYAVQEALARNGVAYDCIYLDDIEIADMARYRCVIFANAWTLTPRQRDLIRERTQGKQVVWIYAPGFSDDNTLDDNHIELVTGMHVKRIPSESSYRVLACDAVYPIKSSHYAPFFAIDDPGAQPVAVYAESGNCAAAHKGNNWYFAMNRLDPDSAGLFLIEAQAHRYVLSGDPILAGEGMVAINCFAGGERDITLRNGKTVHLSLTPLTTAVLDAETGERLL